MMKQSCVGHNVIHPFNHTAAANAWPAHHSQSTEPYSKDHFIEREGILFAGTHMIIDLWGAVHLDEIARIEAALRECVEKARATLLHIHLHHFSPNGGVSGVAVLAESHISVHTWPEREYAAFDIFMCGDSQPEEAIAVLQRAFYPKKIQINEVLRGVVDHD